MSAANSSQGGKKGGKGTVVIIIISAVVILALVGVIVYLVMSREPKEEERRNVVVTPENVQEVIEQMENQGEERTPVGYYTVTMNYEWHFPSGDSVSPDAYVENVKNNTNPVYLDVFLKDDMENAVYKSPVIPVGGSLTDIALDTPLEAGTYDCVAVYHIVDDDQNTLSTLRVTVTLVVEE